MIFLNILIEAFRYRRIRFSAKLRTTIRSINHLRKSSDARARPRCRDERKRGGERRNGKTFSSFTGETLSTSARRDYQLISKTLTKFYKGRPLCFCSYRTLSFVHSFYPSLHHTLSLSLFTRFYN